MIARSGSGWFAALWVYAAVLGAAVTGAGRERRAPAPDPVMLQVLLVSPTRRAEFRVTAPSDGVVFDLDGSGVRRRVGWTAGGSDVAFVAIDTNGNGSIDGGHELVTDRSAPDQRNGFTALRALAMQSNGGIERGSVSEDDPLFAQLLLWTDRNHNGVSERSELTAAGDVFSAIGLGYARVVHPDEHGSTFGFRGWAHIRTAPGRNPAVSSEDNDVRIRHMWEVRLLAE